MAASNKGFWNKPCTTSFSKTPATKAGIVAMMV
jgi:hypothetical protein